MQKTLNKILIIDSCEHARGKLMLFFDLTNKPNKIHSRDEQLKAVWNDVHNLDTRTVDTAIKRLRDKFNKVSPDAAATIKTIWRVGYIFKLKY